MRRACRVVLRDRLPLASRTGATGVSFLWVTTCRQSLPSGGAAVRGGSFAAAKQEELGRPRSGWPALPSESKKKAAANGESLAQKEKSCNLPA